MLVVKEGVEAWIAGGVGEMEEEVCTRPIIPEELGLMIQGMAEEATVYHFQYVISVIL